MKELTNFQKELTDIYGYFLQVHAAILNWNRFLTEQMDSGPTTPRNTFWFGDTDPNSTDARYQYARTYGELAVDSAPEGITSVIHRRTVVVLVVASWEDSYRGRIASELGIEKNDLASNVFHDLNRFRQAILHAGGKLDIQPKTIPLFNKGDEVILTTGDINLIFRLIVDELNRIGRSFTERIPGSLSTKDFMAELLFQNDVEKRCRNYYCLLPW